MKALVADAINEKGIENLKEVCEVVVDTSITPEELLETIGEYDAILIRSRTKLPAEVIEKADNLKIIARAGVGVDNVDVNAATQKGIMVVVIGMGRIGSQVVNRCKAFEMDAIAYDPYLPPEVAKNMGVELYENIEDVLTRADVITIHVPLTPETEHSISTEQFKMMKDTALIFNCARGGIIDEDALYDALANGEILGAGLDVYEEEPAKENKLFELDNIVCTPHIAASTKEAQRDAAIIVANEVITLFKGDMPKNVINMPRMNNAEFEETNNYLELCEKLGSFISQSASSPIKKLEITYKGEIAKLPNRELFTRTILQGILNPITETAVNASASLKL